MKRSLLFVLLFYMFVSYAQEPKIITPSPNASSLHVYGNTQINYYTGSSNVEIPLWEIKEGDLTLPITLKYTGGNGIKVEEIASRVGLGWTLNVGGAISRVTRGKSDEDFDGYMSGRRLPSHEITDEGTLLDGVIWEDVRSGVMDAEPDRFMYNYPTGSGNFFIKKPENNINKIFLKPLKDIEIDFSYKALESNENVKVDGNSIVGGLLGEFNLTDEHGYKFSFTEREWTSSRIIDNEASFNGSRPIYPSSWYLTKIMNPTNTRSIDLEYERISYKYIRQVFDNLSNAFSESKKALNFVFGKKISKIKFSTGTVEFIYNTVTRKDLYGDSSLKKIIVRDINGGVVREFVFSYKYMTANSLVEEDGLTASPTEMNKNRLLLNSITEFAANGDSKPPHVFTYNTTRFLPARDSKSIDHWGFYNGKNNNIKSYLPEHYIEVLNSSTNKWEYQIYGDSDRSVGVDYEQSGILTQIKYPTGGYTNFEYESHKTDSGKFPKIINRKNVGLFLDESLEFSINSSGSGYTKVRLEPVLPDECNNTVLEINIKSIDGGGRNSNYCYTFYADGDGYYCSSNNIINTEFFDIRLKNGQYKVSVEVIGSCQREEDSELYLSWTFLSDAPPNVLVGGVRIKTIKDVTNTSEIVRNFNYEIQEGKTSGVIVSIPKYSFVFLETGINTPYVPTDIVYHSLSPLYPLAYTQGSHVGYGKVTVTKKGISDIKSEYFYTTAEDFPDIFHGKLPIYNSILSNGELSHFVGFKYYSKVQFQGRYFDFYPYNGVSDSKDFLRGLLFHEIHYKNKENTFLPVSEKRTLYEELFLVRPDAYRDFENHSGYRKEYMDDKNNFIEGISTSLSKTLCRDDEGIGDCPTATLLNYDIYSGYTIPTRTFEKSFFYDDNEEVEELNKTTTYIYPKSNEYPYITNFFKAINLKTTDSKGNLIKTKIDYPQDNLTNLTTDASLAIDGLINQHRIATPIQSETTVTDINGDELSKTTQRTDYRVWSSNATGTGNIILPEFVQTLKGEFDLSNNPFQNQITYHDYDDKGNPLEVSKTDGTHIVYIWSYNQQYPVAKINNATHAEVLATGIDMSIINDHTTTDENMQIELDKIRSLASAQVTTYTYAPLIGVTSITDPRGYTIYYEYDDFNRLKQVKDAEGNILSKNEYHYKD